MNRGLTIEKTMIVMTSRTSGLSHGFPWSRCWIR